MPSIDARLKAANADADASPSRTDRKSADDVFLSTANLSSELSRVNSTPLSSEAIDALGLPSSASSSSSQDPLNEPSPLTMAPPKPSPADTLYPSPSGGFVPSPEEGQDWRLKPPPPGRITKPAASSSTTPPATLSLPALKESTAHSSASALSPTAAASNPPTPTRPPSLPSCPETASKIANASSSSLSRRSSQASNAVASPQLRPSSSSSSSRHRLSTAISPLEPASTANDAAQASSSRSSITSQSGARDASPLRSAKSSRPNSTASHQTARNDNAKDDLFASITVRDFAFATDDPRHHGQPLAEPQPSADDSHSADEHGQDADADEHEFFIEGAEDENEFDGDEGDSASVPEGVYNVLYQFDPVSEHELAVAPGDVVHVVGSLEGGWAIAVKDGDESVKGLVPATYLEWSAPLPQ
ncbi:uncharacterized protein SRS1_11320 [Sporisorium reilianum f. sp. reilianum]|uniref:SH3 domain-containing protein n=1 Tax=Sporisorium reilianum f. sp. reilianum TaxID=72559 RepID=A0A2N8UNM7_9BASI|nr:uncharacterized protein SRS1_11320 [Sporisorium reilianum f. sp. reilianum]